MTLNLILYDLRIITSFLLFLLERNWQAFPADKIKLDFIRHYEIMHESDVKQKH